MYSKEEAFRLKQQFWIAFGKYVKPIPSFEGSAINWINYKTGIKNLYFRMNAEQFTTSIAIEITHHDKVIRQIYFEQFKAFKNILRDHLNEDWNWNVATTYQGIQVSQISKTIHNLSVYNQQDWPAIISFLKPRIIALDEFWSNVKPFFEALAS